MTTSSLDNAAAENVNVNNARVFPAQAMVMETNMLRFPMFYLAKRGRNTIDAQQVAGTRTVDGQQIDFTFRVSRNTDYRFPGVASRNIHAALLRILFEKQKGPPYSSLIQFGWRELARYRGISYDGNREEWKDAIRSTKSANIHTKNALISAETGKPLATRERDLSLYEEVAFCGDVFEGKIAETNFVRLSSWFVANLNYNYAAYLDNEYWLRLNTPNKKTKSGGPIASRLLEYCTFLFQAGYKEYVVNYKTLCAYLPMKEYASISRAKQQLDCHLKLLSTHAILSEGTRQALSAYEWIVNEDGVIQIKIIAGPDYQDAVTMGKGTEEECVSLSEEHTDVAPSELIVRDFLLHFGFKRPSTKGERLYAVELMKNHGRAFVEEALRKSGYAILKRRFPAIKTFKGVSLYWDDILKSHKVKSVRVENRIREKQQQTIEESQDAARDAKRARLKKRWFASSRDQMEAWREAAITNAHPQTRFFEERRGVDDPTAAYLAEMEKDGETCV